MTVPSEEFGEFQRHPNIPNWLVGSTEYECVRLGKYTFALEGFDEDEQPDEFMKTMRNFLAHGSDAIQGSEGYLWEYYQDTKNRHETTREFDDVPILTESKQVWDHVKFGIGTFVHIRRRAFGNKAVYVLIEGSCGWDQTSGLSIVLYQGSKVTRVGGYDGHLSNADAFAMPDLENIVYASTRHFSAAWPTTQHHSPSLLSSLPYWCCCGGGGVY